MNWQTLQMHMNTRQTEIQFSCKTFIVSKALQKKKLSRVLVWELKLHRSVVPLTALKCFNEPRSGWRTRIIHVFEDVTKAFAVIIRQVLWGFSEWENENMNLSWCQIKKGHFCFLKSHLYSYCELFLSACVEIFVFIIFHQNIITEGTTFLFSSSSGPHGFNNNQIIMN